MRWLKSFKYYSEGLYERLLRTICFPLKCTQMMSENHTSYL